MRKKLAGSSPPAASPCSTLDNVLPIITTTAAATGSSSSKNKSATRTRSSCSSSEERNDTPYNNKYTNNTPYNNTNNNTNMPTTRTTTTLPIPEEANASASNTNTTTTTAIPLLSRSVQTPGIAPASRLLAPDPYAAARVLKGEIHNVLTVMRAEEYISTNRFVDELDVMHPIAQQLQSVHLLLLGQTIMDPSMLLTYLKPFCVAIQHSEIRAAVTGACLNALHKFVLYGFIVPGGDDDDDALCGPALAMIAESLLECRFEEPEEHPSLSLSSSRSIISNKLGVAAAAAGNRERSMTSRAFKNNNTNSNLASYYTLTPAQEEEHVVLKLLELSALVVRCSLQEQALLDSHILVGLLETCLHVSHKAKRASPLLKSAAADALSQMVLQVFAGTGTPILQTRHEILVKLAGLLNPSLHAPQVTHTSLTLMNIALETCRDPLTPADIAILQNDLCKYLLLTSTTHDVYILTLTLRVIFNLFQSIRNHLKVPLEVFLTSVHLRILEGDTRPEEKEVALESLLEFCQEPELMQDIYLNYDCDVACTNLFEAIVQALGKVALPGGWNPTALMMMMMTMQDDLTERTEEDGGDEHDKTTASRSMHNGGNGSKNSVSTKDPPTVATGSSSMSATTTMGAGVPVLHAESTPLTILNRLSLNGLLAILDSIAKRCRISNKNANTRLHRTLERRTSSVSVTSGGTSSDGDDTEDDEEDDVDSTDVSLGHLEMAPPPSSLQPLPENEFRERKLRKMALSKVTRAFNCNAMSEDWLEMAVQLELVEKTADAKGVSEFFFSAPGIDKVKLGIYLSKGPNEDWPFHAHVRTSFAALFDFNGLNFGAALRKFLSKFRLPGEAQCIDRLMETFSKEYYEQEHSIFKNADAVYVVSFSTIMLNTDLHNPSIAEDKRMTLQQFIKNNRGINDGEDLPEEFLIKLYGEIKDKPIQVRKEMDEIMKRRENVDFKTAWESILTKSSEVADPFFGPVGERIPSEAGVHDKEMFVVLANWLLKDLTGIFLRSWDDALVVKAIMGMKQMAHVAAYFDLDTIVNDILLTLLPMGRDYVMGCVALDRASSHEIDNASSNRRAEISMDMSETSEDTTAESDTPIPYGLLCSSYSEGRADTNIYGSAAHRGILALDCSFVIIRTYGTRVTTAWPSFVECLCALRDGEALPLGLADLDDFADSSGNVLPLSSYARLSHKRLEEYYKSQADPEITKKNQKGWFGSLFRRPENDKDDSIDDGSLHMRRGMSTYARALLGIAEAADVENVIQMGSTKLPIAEQTIKALLEAVGNYPYNDDPVLEQHAVFSLELAARALLSNRRRATKLFPLFLNTFETILTGIYETNLRATFVVERVAVTVLRCCIHLYDLPEVCILRQNRLYERAHCGGLDLPVISCFQLRPHLRSSLHLLTMGLPRSFMNEIADRMACGLAIIVRASFHFFDSANEWDFIGDTLDVLAHHSDARVFVFDGIASTVEYAIPAHDTKENGTAEADRQVLSKFACTALARILIRFVMGFYQNDFTLSVPALLCLEKVYRYNNELLLEETDKSVGTIGESDPISVVLDANLWQNVAVAMYTACRSTDFDLSRRGVDCYQRLMLQTGIDQIPDERWIAILYLMVNKQPPLVAQESRINTFAVLGKLMCRVIPALSHNTDNREDLYDLIGLVAALAQENLRHGRKGSITPLFEQTLQTVTYMSNHMTTDEWNGERDFSSWASETLLAELEKVGAAGASAMNQAAVMPATHDNPAGQVTAESS